MQGQIHHVQLGPSINSGTATELLSCVDAPHAHSKHWYQCVPFAHSSLLNLILLWLAKLRLQACLQAPRDALFRLDQHKDDPKLDQQAAAPLLHLRQIQPSLCEQAESVMAHLTNPTERLMEANAMLESWKRASGRELCVPQWLAQITE